MNYPLVSEYVSAIESAECHFATLTTLRPVLTADGRPFMCSGSSAVVFKMRDTTTGKLHAVKCFTKEVNNGEACRRMTTEVPEDADTSLLTPVRYLERELHVVSTNTTDTEFPILLMDWMEEVTASTAATDEDKAGAWTDECGVTYSRDGMRLLKGNASLTSYVVRTGTRVVCNGAFYNCKALKDITLPQGLRHIGSDAFSGCSALRGITLPQGMRSIGGSVFWGCTSLESVIMPQEVTNIADWAFCECKALRRIELPQGMVSIGYGAFYRCESLESIMLPQGLAYVGWNAFRGCKALRSIALPQSLSSIGGNPFVCSGIRDISSASERLRVEEGFLYADNRLIAYFGQHPRIDALPQGITVIGDRAFSNCLTLEHIALPQGVTTIGSNAFTDCEALRDVILPQGVTHIGIQAFAGCGALRSVALPQGIASIGNAAFDECRSLDIIIIPQGTSAHYKALIDDGLCDKLAEQ